MSAAAPQSVFAPVTLPPWGAGLAVKREALLFRDGDILLAPIGRTADDLAAEWGGSPSPDENPERARVRVTVLEILAAPRPADQLPASVAEILRAVRDTPHLAPKFRDEIDRVLSGRAA